MTNINHSSDQATNNAHSPLNENRPTTKLKNWAGNIEYTTNNLYYPQTLEEVQDLVVKHTHLKALGSRHCFNHIADSENALLSTQGLNKVVYLDTQNHTVTVESGMKYGELAPYLHANGYALPNLASLPHISVAGSVITATHGSGVKNGNLATAVSALEIVTADGTLHTFSRKKDKDLFNGVVVNLGALGIVTKITLDLQPTFIMRQFVYENLPLTQLQDNFTSIVSAGYSVSLFTDWSSENITEVWIKCRMNEASSFDGPLEFYGAKAATQPLHPIANVPAENCTNQLGVPGAWHDRLPHFKMGFTPSTGLELQSEYFIGAQHAVEAIRALARLGKQINPYLFISEIRTIAPDNLWLSPCYKQQSVALHFTWKQDWPAVSKILPLIEKELASFHVRPHWGKLFTMSPNVIASVYERLPDFKNLVAQYDPKGKFRNKFLNVNIFNV